MLCPRCTNKIPPAKEACPACGFDLRITSGDVTGGVIPYKNPKALIAYYLGILSGLPMVGLPLGIIAVILGVMGLRDRARNPIIKGSIHAGIGIGCGGLFTLLWGVLIVGIILAKTTEMN